MRTLGLYTAYAGGALSAFTILVAVFWLAFEKAGWLAPGGPPGALLIAAPTGLALTIIGAALYFGWRGR